MELYVAVLSGLIAALVLWWRSTKHRRPPGPWGLPIVGYLPFLTSKPYMGLIHLAKRYGPVFRVRLGSLNMLVLNDFQSTKEAFGQDAFIGRPPEIPFMLNEETERTGAFFGLPWKEQRRQCLHLLRDLGFGKSRMEAHIQEEIEELLEHFEKNADKPYCIRDVLAPSMSNIIGSLVFGKRMKYDDPMRKMLTNVIAVSSKEAGQTKLLIFFPWIKKVIKFLGIGPADKLSEVNAQIKDYIKKEIDEHEATLNPDNIRDFIDGYLLEIQKRKDDPTFTKNVLQDLVGAFFGGGSETVRQTIEWLVLTTASDQNAQRRIHNEILEVIGPNRPPIWPDHKEMPYTMAFISEVMRSHRCCTLTDTELNGYFIPKHTRVLSNTWAIHHNPEYWGADADEFRPERFLTEDGKEVKKMEHFIPFSTGKRACPGEPLAKVEVFMYFASILQRFSIKMPEGKVADFEGVLGIGLNPKEQDIVLTKRN